MRPVLLPGLLIYSIALLTLGGCGSTPPRSGDTPPYSSSTAAAQQTVLKTALSVLGRPYHYGGRHPRHGFDCSGLVYYTHQQAGLTLPRTSHAQYVASTPVPRHALRPGDLVFFRITRRKVSHVGIYLGDDRFIHAPATGKSVSTDSISDPYWDKRFVRGGRFF